MKRLLVAFCLAIPTTALAVSNLCYNSIIDKDGDNFDSAHIFGKAEDLVYPKDESQLAKVTAAKETLYKVLKPYNCNPTNLVISADDLMKNRCKRIIDKDPTSEVCYITSNTGYFFISKNMLDGVNIIFNRWD